jgi:hypothetical protein
MILAEGKLLVGPIECGR